MQESEKMSNQYYACTILVVSEVEYCLRTQGAPVLIPSALGHLTLKLSRCGRSMLCSCLFCVTILSVFLLSTGGPLVEYDD